jgi:hypothetical protein
MAKKRQNSARQLDHITPADFEIFKLAAQNPNYFTDHYVRTNTSGTYWMKTPTPFDEDKAAAWEVMFYHWKKAGQPEPFVFSDIPYELQFDANDQPIFFQRHGWLWQDWQRNDFLSQQPEHTIIGGMGVGKTVCIGMEHIVFASLLPNYRGYHVAPKMLQANEVYRAIISNCQGTPLWDRWVWAYPQKPYPKIVIRNDYVGESTIEILSVEHEPDKVKTLEGDFVSVDQGEQFTENFEELILAVGSRLRGQIHGRSRLGRLSIVANSEDNPALWYRYDMAELEPETYYSISPKTWDNIFLTKSQLADMKRRVGGDEQSIAQHMGAARPIGSGEHFPAHVIQLCLDKSLDEVMNYQQEIPDTHPHKNTDYIKLTAPKVGIFKWEMPPDRGRDYIVIGDPGQGNPPGRNSAPIMVWDVTDFPEKPATLRAFHWVFCNGSYWPFLNAYEEYVKRYRAQTRNAFDSTGSQKGFDELVFTTMNLAAEGMDLSNMKKMHALNAAKFFMGKGMMKFPYISHLVNQLANYRLPDTKVAQDLVMCVSMAALYIRRYYYEDIPDIEDETTKVRVIPHGRYWRPRKGRFSRAVAR